MARLSYNKIYGRYALLISDLWANEGYHCGETLEVNVDGKWIKTRMELERVNGRENWYLVDTPYYGNLENVQVRVTEKYES